MGEICQLICGTGSGNTRLRCGGHAFSAAAAPEGRLVLNPPHPVADLRDYNSQWDRLNSIKSQIGRFEVH